MKIAVDINPLLGKSIGRGVYLKNLLYALSDRDKKNTYKLYGYEHPSIDLGNRFSFVQIAGSEGRRWDVKVLFRSIVVDKADIYVTTDSLLGAILHPHSILLLHDLAIIKYPNLYPKKVVSNYKKHLTLALRRARKIITPSSVTKSHIVDKFNIPRKKVVKISGGVPRWTRSEYTETVTNKILDLYSLPEKYFLFVGTIEPRKNLTTLIEAFKEFRASTEDDHKLVIVGKKGLGYEEIAKKLIDIGLSQDVIFTGFVPESDLKPIYSHATALVVPSYLEGFGLTPLEAMSCGVPVICSKKGAIGEAVADSCLDINPRDVGSIATAFSTIVKDESLVKELVEKGAKRVKKFSWKKSAIKLLKVFKEVHNG